MNKLIFRVLAMMALGLLLFSYVFPWNSYGIQVPFSGPDYRLGLDLQGGIELDYKVDLEEAKQAEDYSKAKESDIIEGLKSIVDKRIESLNINDSVITSASYGGEQHIIVQIPLKWNSTLENQKNIEAAKEAIGKVVKIEFRELRWEISEADRLERKALAETILDEAKNSSYDFFVTANKYKISKENIDIGTLDLEKIKAITEFDGDIAPGLADTIIEADGVGNFSFDSGYWIVAWVAWENGKVETANYIFVTATPSDWKPAADSEWRILNDSYFVNSSVQFNEAFQAMVELTFNSDGADIFGELTSRLVGQPIAIFVGWENLTAPTVNEPILSGRAVVTGNYTPESAKKLATDINTWVVPAPIYLTSEQSIDSKLGASSLEKLLIAWVTGFILIFIFLIAIYRVSGVLASISLFIYVMLVLSIVKTLGIVLTLASVAGLILSIGMAIDANILIFERIKDEFKNTTSLAQASRDGFKKSWSAIWDSNLTGFIVALILFIFGINLIKGFGFMLGLGILVSLFSVYWVSRILVFLAARVSKDKLKFIGKK